MAALSAPSRPSPESPAAAPAESLPTPAPRPVPAALALSAVETMAAMARGALSAEALMEATLAQIAALNPVFTAITGLRPAEELMAEARAADALRASGAPVGPLHGLPMAIKDLAAAKGLPSTMGSPLFAKDGPAPADCLMAARIRGAGAILIGKTNVPEFGLGSHSFNPLYGATRNPFDPNLSAGGSSGGAAAALALRMVALADGSDMMGSLRNPSGWNGIWALRPTWGLVPNDQSPEVHLHQLSTDGPMARTVGDLALLLSVMAGTDPGLPHSRPAPAPGLAERVATGTLQGVRIGWLGDLGGKLPLGPGMAESMAATRAALTERGAIIEDAALSIDMEAVWQAWVDLRAWAVAMKAAAWKDDPAKWAALKPEMHWEAAMGADLSAARIHAASVTRGDLHRAFAALETQYDALALPTAQLFPFPVQWRWPSQIAGREMDTYHRWMECVVPASLTGRPAISMPAMRSAEGLPTGVQLIGAIGADEALLKIGAGWERSMPAALRALPPVLQG